MLMTATLAERLGLITAAEGDQLEEDAPGRETPAYRALRRAGVVPSCLSRTRPTGDGIKACVKRWQRREQRLPRGGCPKAPAGHTLAMAWEVRSMRAGGERCVGDMGTRGEAT